MSAAKDGVEHGEVKPGEPRRTPQAHGTSHSRLPRAFHPEEPGGPEAPSDGPGSSSGRGGLIPPHQTYAKHRGGQDHPAGDQAGDPQGPSDIGGSQFHARLPRRTIESD